MMSQSNKQSESAQQNANMPPQGYFIPMASREGYDKEEISLFDLWRMLNKNKMMIIVIALLSTVIAASYAFLATPIYRAEVLLVSAQDEGAEGGKLAALASQFGGLASIAGISLGGGGNAETAMAILQSREFTEQYIRERNLLPVLFSDRWDQEKGAWKERKSFWFASDKDGQGSGGPAPGSEEVPTMWDAYKLVREKVLSTATDKRTGLITLAVEWRDPVLAAEWANDAVNRVNEHIRHQAITEAEKKIAFLREELSKTSVVEAKRLLYAIMEEQINGIMLANVRDEYAFKIIDPAVVPEERIKPKRKVIVIIGFVLGVILGGFFVFVRHASQRFKESSEEPA